MGIAGAAHQLGGDKDDLVGEDIGAEAALDELSEDAVDGGDRGQRHIEDGKLQEIGSERRRGREGQERGEKGE